MAALTAKGVTPASNNLEDILTAINNITTDVEHTVTISGWRDNNTQEGIIWLYIDGSMKLNGFRIRDSYSYSYTV